MRTNHATIRNRLAWEASAVVATALVLFAGCEATGTSDATKGGTDTPAVTALPASLPGIPDAPAAISIPEPEVLVLSGESQVRAAWREAVSLVDDRNYDDALRLLEAVAVERPGDAGVQYLLGIARWKTGGLDDAETALAKSVEIDAGRFKGWLNLARVTMDAGRFEEAREAASRASELDPASADARHQLGRALYALGRVDEAVETLGIGRELDPTNGHVANTLGWVLIRQERFHDAVAPLEVARAALPGVAYVRNNLGMAYERTGRRAEAVSEYRAALEAGDPDGKAAGNLARLGEPAEAGATVAAR